MVSVNELQKSVTDTKRENVNPQEPPSIIPQVSHAQPLVKILEATFDNIDTIEKSTVETQVTTIEQQEIGQIELSAPITQDQGASQVIMEVKGKPKETELTPKFKEQVAIQALVSLPTFGTPSTQTL